MLVCKTVMPICRIVLCAAAITIAAASLANARPDTRNMTCAQTQALIQTQHAAVLATGPNTYDRYVRQFGNECDVPYVPMVAYIPHPGFQPMEFSAAAPPPSANQ